jgi:hypothetical protein
VLAKIYVRNTFSLTIAKSKWLMPFKKEQSIKHSEHVFRQTGTDMRHTFGKDKPARYERALAWFTDDAVPVSLHTTAIHKRPQIFLRPAAGGCVGTL